MPVYFKQPPGDGDGGMAGPGRRHAASEGPGGSVPTSDDWTGFLSANPTFLSSGVSGNCFSSGGGDA